MAVTTRAPAAFPAAPPAVLSVRELVKQNGFLVVAVFEVVPDDGSPAFVDQETLLVGEESLRKLSPGNVVRVRFDGARKRVFPTTPVTVLATGV